MNKYLCGILKFIWCYIRTIKIAKHETNFFLIVLTFFCIKKVSSQNIEIEGNILDKENIPIEYASVIAYKLPDSLLLGHATTNEAGKFKLIISANKIKKGATSLLKVDSYGFMPFSKELILDKDTNIGTVVLEDIGQLEEVVIRSEKKQVTIEGTEKSIDPSKNLLSQNGSAIEVLSQVPGVWINRDGELILNGKKGVTVMINGQPQILNTEGLNAVLRSIDAQSVKNILVNTLPSAKNDATGAAGTIDIKIQEKQSNGIDSNVSLATHFRNETNLLGSWNMRVKQNKWYIGTSIGFSNTSRLLDVDNIFWYRNNGLETDADIIQNQGFRNKNFNSTIKYEVNDKNVIGLLVNGFDNKTENPVVTTTHIRPINSEVFHFADSISITDSQNKERLKSISSGLFWKHDAENGNSLYLSTDYSVYNKSFDVEAQTSLSLYDTPQNILRDDVVNFSIPYDVSIFSSKLDYSIPLKEQHLLELGVKYSNTENNSRREFSFSSSPEISESSFDYNEDIFSVFTNYSGQKNFDKNITTVNYQLGLRLEHTNPDFNFSDSNLVTMSDYTRLFPSANLSLVFKSNNALTFGYNRRIQRPLYNELSPFVYYLSDYISREGNATLIPEDIHNFLVSYTFNKGKGNIELNYSHTLDKITQMPFQNAEDFSVILQNVNIQKRQNFSATGIFQNKINHWWKITNTISGVFDRYYQDDFEGSSLDMNKLSVSCNVVNNFSISKDLKAQITGLYLSPFIDGLYETSDYFMMSVGLKKSFLKDKLNLNLELQDIFNTYKDDVNVNFNSLQSRFIQKIDTRIFKISLTYNFKSGTKINKASEKQSNESEKSRVN
ncbi:outer membrane beta-barrel family protein [Tenacibaculum tangerinum]|uniref:Outer membrane beta-barrel family protein n=1 Tax=Tenacibaculum tangerinum TaxID=3038772 RepID=A0ABY8L2A1_9FLAO|nr:outer membrane beta-barrel family protein [Tenacibaculum tangerinum]WGH74220.1 outer membrane beta-barrel family protein [Tenacibaculum tangerinum]